MDLLSYSDIAVRVGVSVTLLQQWVHRGKFPPPDVKPNPNVALWYEQTVIDWERHRV